MHDWRFNPLIPNVYYYDLNGLHISLSDREHEVNRFLRRIHTERNPRWEVYVAFTVHMPRRETYEAASIITAQTVAIEVAKDYMKKLNAGLNVGSGNV